MISVSTACSAAAHALGEGFRWVQDGQAKVMVAGGYDSLTTWMDVLGFSLLGSQVVSRFSGRVLQGGGLRGFFGGGGVQ